MALTAKEATDRWTRSQFMSGLDASDSTDAWIENSLPPLTSQEAKKAQEEIQENRARPPIDWQAVSQANAFVLEQASKSVGGMREFNQIPYTDQLLLIQESGGFAKPEDFRFESKRQAEFEQRFRSVSKKQEVERLSEKQSGGQTIGPQKPPTGSEDFLNGIKSGFFRLTPPGSVRTALFGGETLEEVVRPTEGTAGALGSVVASVIPSAAALLSPPAWPFVLSAFGGSAAREKFDETESAFAAIGAGLFEAGAELLQFKGAAKLGKSTLASVGKLAKNGKFKDATLAIAGGLGISATEGLEELVTLAGTNITDVAAGVQTIGQAVDNIRQQAIPTFLLGTAGGTLLTIPALSSKQARQAFVAALDVEASTANNEQPLPESIDLLTGLFGTTDFDITTQETFDATQQQGTEDQIQEASRATAVEEQPVEQPTEIEAEDGVAQRQSEGEEVAAATQTAIEQPTEVAAKTSEDVATENKIVSEPEAFVQETVSKQDPLSEEDLSNIDEARISSELRKPFGRLELNRLASDIGIDPTNKTGEVLTSEVLKALPSIATKRAREGGFVDPELFAAPVRGAIKAAKWTASSTTDAARWLLHATGGVVKNLSQARKALIGKFGDGIKNKIGAIWSSFKNIMSGHFELSTPKSVFSSSNPVSVPTLDKFAKELKGAKRVRKQASEAIRKERRRRSAVIAEIQQKNTGRDAVFKSLGALKGEMESVSQDFEPLDNISIEESNDLINHLNTHPSLDGKPIEKAGLGQSVLRIIDSGALPKPGEIIKLEAIFGPKIASALLGKRTPKARTISTIDEIVGLPRTIKASFDLSAAGRQGFVVSIAHPKIAQEAFSNQIQALASSEYAIALDQQLRNLPGSDLMELSGLELPPVEGVASAISDREEIFMSRILQRMAHIKGKTKAGKAILLLPKLATQPIRASERAYITYLNYLRTQTFLGAAEQMVNAGQTFDTHSDDFKALAKLINTSTGRGKTGFTVAEQGFSLAALVNFSLFSPKFLASRIENLFVRLPQALLSKNKFVKREAHRQLVSVMSTWLMMAGIIQVAKEAYGLNVGMSLNPESGDFLKLRLGDKTTIDLGAGFGSLIRPLTQITTGYRVDPAKEKRVKANRAFTAVSFARGKMAPVPSAVISSVEGKSFGRETTPATEFGKLFVPISAETLVEVWKEHGAAGLGLMVPEIVGLGVNIKPEKKKDLKFKRRKSKRRRFAAKG